MKSVFERIKSAVASRKNGKNSVDNNKRINQKEIRVDIGDRILVNLNDQIVTLEMVEDTFAELTDDKVSFFSPIGSALMGRKVNDEFEMILSRGELVRCKILEIL